MVKGPLSSATFSGLKLRGIGYKERHESELSVHELTRLDVYKSVVHGLGVLDTIRAFDYQGRGLLLALKAGEPSRVARSLIEGAASTPRRSSHR